MNTYKPLRKRIARPTDIPFLNAVIFHVLLGILIYSFEFLSLLYYIGIMIYFITKIIRQYRDPAVALEGAAYITGVEVFLRMTHGAIFWETGKYSVMLLLLVGMFFHGFKTKALIYVGFILLLLPALYLTYLQIPYDMNFRTNILFNLSGPLSLGVTAIYCYDLRIKFSRFLDILDYLLLPLIAMTFYIMFYTPDLQEVVTGAEGSAAASGGFGPNQVSTALGIGVFILLVRLFIPYKNFILQIATYVLLPLMAFRGLATLSRGGIFTAILMFVAFFILYNLYSSAKQKSISLIKIGIIVGGGIFLWGSAVVATNNMLLYKYTNRNASGEKQDEGSITTGRLELAVAEFSVFVNNPYIGAGIGMSKIKRKEYTGEIAATHSEISRILGEHGILGVFALAILLIVPLVKFFNNTRNLFMIPLLVFWFATINHSAMRVAAPGFMYGLALVSVQFPGLRQKARQGVKSIKHKYHGYKAAVSGQ